MTDKPINIVSAELLDGYRLQLRFDDGSVRVVDFQPFLARAAHPAIRAYLDPARFAAFMIEYGDLVWGEYDLCFPIMDLYLGHIEHGAALQAAA